MATFEPPPTYAEVVVVDDKTQKGRFNPIWLKWFLKLVTVLTNSGATSGSVQHNATGGLQGGSANQYYHLTASEHANVNIRNLAAMSTITPSGSPYSYTNSTDYDEDVIVRGGTVSAVEHGRGGSYESVGVVAGMFRLSPGDVLRVTYTVAPTMRLVPR